MDPMTFLQDIIDENLDRLIVARLEQDLELVSGCDPVLEAALRRVIKFLDVALDASDSHAAGESYENF